jgi:hypothetical protein
MFTFEHSHPSRPDLDCRIEIGVDTVRIGFWPWSASWNHRNRLQDKGWHYEQGLHCWLKHHDDNGMTWRHWPEWIDVEVSLPRVIGPNNSSMVYHPWDALATIKVQLDSDIELELANSVFRSPDWDEWCVSRADITADFTFTKESEVTRIIEVLPTARMTHRPNRWIQPPDKPTSIKWASKAKRVACSIYDKFVESNRDEDKGKVRMTVILNERRNKPHLRKHSMQRATGLFNGDEGKFLSILVAEVKRFRPTHKVNTLRYLLEQASNAYPHGAC